VSLLTVASITITASNAITMTEVTITTRGEHNSTARADSADLTLDITTEEDRDHAPARVERTLAILVSTLQQLAPNIPSTRLPQSTTKVLHPASDAAVASYTVARVRVVALKAPSSMMVSKTSSVSVLKSSGASKSAKESVRASTRIVIAFRDVAALQRFAAKAAAVVS
jgi:hypothetical protein